MRSVKIADALVVITFVMVAAFFIGTVRTINYRSNVFSIEGLIQVKEKEIKDGDPIKLDLSYCLNTDDPILIKRTLRDNQVVNLDESPVPIILEQGCHTVPITIYTDKGLPPDEYNITFYVTIPTQNFGKIYQTETFIIF